MGVSRRPVALVALMLLTPAASARAQTLVERGPPAHRVVHRSLVAVRGNPIGLIFDGRLGYRLRLRQDDRLAFRDNFLGLGLAATVSPAFANIGPVVELAPAAFVTLWGSLQYSRYFGSFGLMQSFASPRADFSDDEIDRRADLPDGDPLESYSSSGFQAVAGVDLQARVGTAAVRSQTRFLYADLDLREGDTTFYDQTNDLLLADQGWAVVSDLDAVYLAMNGRLALGLRYTASLPLYSDDDYAPGEPTEHDNATHRLGPLAAYSFYSRDGLALNAPTLILIAQWWLDHRYRAGEETSQALPLIGLAFRIHGDLLPLD